MNYDHETFVYLFDMYKLAGCFLIAGLGTIVFNLFTR